MDNNNGDGNGFPMMGMMGGMFGDIIGVAQLKRGRPYNPNGNILSKVWSNFHARRDEENSRSIAAQCQHNLDAAKAMVETFCEIANIPTKMQLMNTQLQCEMLSAKYDVQLKLEELNQKRTQTTMMMLDTEDQKLSLEERVRANKESIEARMGGNNEEE